MIALAENALPSSLLWIRSPRPVLSLLVLTGFCPCCFAQLPSDLTLPSQTLNAGSQVFQASSSITNSGSFVVQDSASVALVAGSTIRLEPGFDAVAGSAPFTYFAVIDPNVGQGPPNEGDGPPSIPLSFTAPAHAPTCDSISGQWIDSDSVGNSVGWDLNQSGSSITGTLSFDDLRDFGTGPYYCGRITYSASGVFNGSTYSLSAVNPVPATDSCGYSLAASETENVALSGQACGSGNGAYTISGGGGGAHALFRAASTPSSASAQSSVQPAATSGTSTWTTYSPRFNVSYSSYIPVDNVYGPTPCYYGAGGGAMPMPYPLLYKGDANRGTYRTTQAIFVAPNKQVSNNFFANVGPTRNYGVGSPANGSILSSYPTTPDLYDGPYAGADEDSKQFDCHFWNHRGKAGVATMQGHNVTFSGNQATVNFNGSAQDPLEPKYGSIDWNAIITLDSTDPSHPTAQVSITHTCYPAHTVKINGVTLLDDQPPHNYSAYLAFCLLDPTGLSNITKNTGAIQVPNK